jgi:hypothetical protein
MKWWLIILLIALALFFVFALNPLQKSPNNFVFLDDLEKYSNDKGIQKAYTVWKDGAVLDVSLQENLVHSGEQSLGINIISPNPGEQSANGSIYHILPYSQRDWSDGTGVRFWVINLNTQPLSLSFNFKEEFNEYWAVSGDGAFFLQGEDDALLQQKIQYGNLQIPAIFQGFVVIPFYSFSVPGWNTALGDNVMNLARIESFAIAVNKGEVLPHFFQIDDIEIFTRPEIKTLEIQGSDAIQIPASGEHREQYIALLGVPSERTAEPVKATWTVRQPADALIKIDDSGILTIPAGVKGNSITLTATYALPENSVTGEFNVVLAGGSAPDAGQGAGQPSSKPITTSESTISQFSKAFEAWVMQNRVLFVVISVGTIFLFLSLLSLFQRRLK